MGMQHEKSIFIGCGCNHSIQDGSGNATPQINFYWSAAVAILSKMAHGCNTQNQLFTQCSCCHSVQDSPWMWHSKSIVESMQLSPFHPGRWWECDTQNQFLLGAAVAIPSKRACGCDTQKSIVDLVQLLPFHPGRQWECDTQNQFLSTVPSTMPTVTNTTALLCLGAEHEVPWRWTETMKISSPPWAEVDLQDVVGWMCDQASQVLEYARTFWCMSADKFF